MLWSKTTRPTLAVAAIATVCSLTGCAPNLTTFGNGITSVGNGSGQVKPGLYTTNATGANLCSWFRQKDLSPIMHGNILGSHSGWGGGRQFVQLEKTDVGIDSEGCGPWVAPIARSYNAVTTRARNGEFRVNTDLKPGTYSTSGSSTSLCEWDRLRSFDGGPRAIIASGANYGPMTVKIASTDVGFDNHGCGTWTRVGS